MEQDQAGGFILFAGLIAILLIPIVILLLISSSNKYVVFLNFRDLMDSFQYT